MLCYHDFVAFCLVSHSFYNIAGFCFGEVALAINSTLINLDLVKIKGHALCALMSTVGLGVATLNVL